MKSHRALVPTLLVVATLIGFLGAFAVWVNRQALNTDNWATTSGKLLANQQIRNTLGAYLVDEVFSNVDVSAELQRRLPPQAQALAGPASAGLKELAGRAGPELLARPRVQDAWVAANIAAHRQLIKIVNGGSDAVSTESGQVTLNLHTLVTELAQSLGVAFTPPPAVSGQLVIMKSDQLAAAQDVAGAIKGLAVALPIIAIALFALAIYLAGGRRRRALRMTGWCFVLIGVLLLLIRRVAGDTVVDALVKVPANRPAVHEVWNIATSLLYALAVALIAYGLIVVACAWIAGATRPARFLRKAMAPTLREQPGMAYGAVGAVLLLAVVWGPTPALRNVFTILLFAGLLALGVAMLRRETEREFPDVQPGDALRDLRAERSAARRRRAAAAVVEVRREADSAVTGAHLDELERLVALHDRGDLSDQEFAAEKTLLVSAPPA